MGSHSWLYILPRQVPPHSLHQKATKIQYEGQDSKGARDPLDATIAQAPTTQLSTPVLIAVVGVVARTYSQNALIAKT